VLSGHQLGGPTASSISRERLNVAGRDEFRCLECHVLPIINQRPRVRDERHQHRSAEGMTTEPQGGFHRRDEFRPRVASTVAASSLIFVTAALQEYRGGHFGFSVWKGDLLDAALPGLQQASGPLAWRLRIVPAQIR
jgi:hypothetical protein